MRRVKFRAWDVKNKKMLSWSEVKECLVATNFDIYQEEDFILLEYTGIKDKNGKEIYEGDILSWKMRSPLYGQVEKYYEETGVVGWKEKEACFTVGKSNFGFVHTSEIIGNIYEGEIK